MELVRAGGDAKVVEIGCGDGRDAEEIVKRVGWYEGFDPSLGLLQLARERLPSASFVEADALSYDYPKGVDIVFAFASLLHVNKANVAKVSQKVRESLRPDGIFYLSLKERADYEEELVADQLGERMFYYYNPEIIRGLAGASFKAIYEEHYKIDDTPWFSMAMRKESTDFPALTSDHDF